MRKLLASLLKEEDENELRAECYFQLSSLFVERARGLKEGFADEKKGKEIASLASKLERETVEQLQEQYYSHSPTCKNSFTMFFITTVFVPPNRFRP